MAKENANESVIPWIFSWKNPEGDIKSFIHSFINIQLPLLFRPPPNSTWTFSTVMFMHISSYSTDTWLKFFEVHHLFENTFTSCLDQWTNSSTPVMHICDNYTFFHIFGFPSIYLSVCLFVFSKFGVVHILHCSIKNSKLRNMIILLLLDTQI